MVKSVVKIPVDDLAPAFGEVALSVNIGDRIAVTGVDANEQPQFDQRLVNYVTHFYESIGDYRAGDHRLGLINATVSFGCSLVRGPATWTQRVTGSIADAERLKRLTATLNVRGGHRGGMSLLTEKKLQLAIAAVNTTDCLFLDDPPRELGYWERLDYWQAVEHVAAMSPLGIVIRTADLDLLTDWLSRLIVIKHQRVVVDAPMRRIQRVLAHDTLLRIDRQGLTAANQRALLATYPQCELTAQTLLIQVRHAQPAVRLLVRLGIDPRTYSIEAGRLSHFVTRGLLKNDLQLYWLNRTLNM